MSAQQMQESMNELQFLKNALSQQIADNQKLNKKLKTAQSKVAEFTNKVIKCL